MAISLSAPDSSVLHASINGGRKLRSCTPFLSFRPLPEVLPCSRFRCSRSFRILPSASASASNNNNKTLEGLAARLTDAARFLGEKTSSMIESSWLQTMKFLESQELQGRMEQSFYAANRKLEELSYDARKGAENLDRQYRVSERAQKMVDFARQKVKNVDQQVGLVQKLQKASTEFRRNWPMYRRQLDQFLRTPIGRTVTMIIFMWFLLSGWLFRLVLFSMWVLPLAAPLLISSAARNMTIEGACPSCKRRFIGNRYHTVVCNYCKSVVWQPRQDFSEGQSDPTIIDVDID